MGRRGSRAPSARRPGFSGSHKTFRRERKMILFPFQRRIASFLYFLFIVIATLPAGAEGAASAEEIPTLEPVVVTSTKTEVPLAQAAGSVTIIDRKIIEEKRLITVGEALREVPGLDLVQTGGPGGTTSAFL